MRGKDVFVIQSHPAPLNNWLMEQLIMVDSMKRASARRITVVSPFYPYARQDKKGRGREPISARLVADLYKTAGADRIMSVDLHTAQIQGFFDGPVDHLMAIPLLADYIRARVGSDNVTVVSPDTGRVRVAEQWADRLGGVPLAFVHKCARPHRAQPGRLQDGRRADRGPHLRAHRRHDRHGRDHFRRRSRPEGTPARRTSSSPRPTPSSPIRRRSACPSPAPARWSSPTRSRFRRPSASSS